LADYFATGFGDRPLGMGRRGGGKIAAASAANATHKVIEYTTIEMVKLKNRFRNCRRASALID
jgi:hypothetical protein